MGEDPPIDKATFRPFKKGRRGKMSMYSDDERNGFARRVHEKEITASVLAKELGVTRQAISLWLKHYRETVLGLKLKPRKQVKKKRFPTRDELHALQWEMRTLRPSKLGIDGGEKDIWTEKSVDAYIAREMGEKFYSVKKVWRWMEDYLIDEEPDPWTIKDRKKREQEGKTGPPPREVPIAFDSDQAPVKKRGRGRPRKGEESTDVRKLDAAEVERMEKEIAEVRADMIAKYRETADFGPPAPGQRVGKNRKAAKSRHTKSRKKKRKKK